MGETAKGDCPIRSAGWRIVFHPFFLCDKPMDAFSPKAIVRAYQKRGTMENYIEEVRMVLTLIECAAIPSKLMR